MARVTALEMARILQQQGYKVEIGFRKEGGARITRINGKHFTGSAGNIAAREILGVKLSIAQEKHLENIRQRKGVFGKKKKAPLPDDIIKTQNKINRAFKAKGKSARVTRAKIRYRMSHFGEAETRKYLKRALQYAKGYVYTESLEVYIQRLELDKGLVQGSDIQHLQAIINRVQLIIARKNLKEDDFQELLSLTYEWEKSATMGLNLMPTKSFRTGALRILSRAE